MSMDPPFPSPVSLVEKRVSLREVAVQCRREELANALTHGLGLLACLPALALLVWAGLRTGSVPHLAGAAIYGVTLTLLYASSTSYHACTCSHWKHRLRSLDHACIYLLIAGTYTPFMLTFMAGPVGYTVLALVWGLAVAGVIIKLFHTGKFDGWSTLAYVLMGWAIVPVFHVMLATFPAGAILWMLAGGLLYTSGVIFYRLDHRVKYFHAVWHLCVLAGSACQYFAVVRYVLFPLT